ncbi:olfactory receptor 6F1-like [Python bivittatus]|uniref:Olfactory receptor n=1 Tax=Python bivittatus TaxID=176946 RepID=A0A9F2R6V3_PYTBI|nr:olfactory receptor 6F1-like [Python bivittatus]
MQKHNLREHNETKVMEFILLGFPGPQYLQMLIFIFFVIMYILTVFGNMAIIILVATNRCLHTPMYFFLCNLSFLEIWYTTSIIPKSLAVILGRSKTISFTGCILQMYFVFSFGCTEYLLLSAMAYDRYLAICYPLHYNTIMDIHFSCKLAAASWMSGSSSISVLVLLISRLSFCGPNVINHFYCNTDSWIVLSCTDTQVVELVTFVLSIIVILCTFVIILVSYICIILAVLHIPSAKGRQKAFSTCSSHLAVIILWYGSTIFLYVKPSKRTSLEMTKLVNILNTIVTPLLNPFIYTLRNKDVREALKSLWHWK